MEFTADSNVYFVNYFSRTNVVMNYTEIEAKVREATNDEAWGPTGKVFIFYCDTCSIEEKTVDFDYL